VCRPCVEPTMMQPTCEVDNLWISEIFLLFVYHAPVLFAYHCRCIALEWCAGWLHYNGARAHQWITCGYVAVRRGLLITCGYVALRLGSGPHTTHLLRPRHWFGLHRTIVATATHMGESQNTGGGGKNTLFSYSPKPSFSRSKFTWFRTYRIVGVMGVRIAKGD
jgi:hypothetical protein